MYQQDYGLVTPCTHSVGDGSADSSVRAAPIIVVTAEMMVLSLCLKPPSMTNHAPLGQRSVSDGMKNAIRVCLPDPYHSWALQAWNTAAVLEPTAAY